MDSIMQYDGRATLDRKNLKSFDYTRSLLAEAARCGRISPEDETRVQTAFLNQLGALISDYTGGESSSLCIETAGELLSGLLFQTDTCLRALGDPEKALDVLMFKPLGALRDEGIRLLRRTAVEVTTLLINVKRTRLPVPNGLYDDMIDRDIREALKKYDPLFFPQNIDGGTDYTLVTMPYGLRGIFYLRSYLANMAAENSFCRAFETRELALLYAAWCREQGVSPDDAVGNIYSLVYANALFCEYLKKDPGTLTLTEKDCEVAEQLLGDLNEAEQKAILIRCADALPQSKLSYSAHTLSKLLPGILNAIRNRTLRHNLVILTDHPDAMIDPDTAAAEAASDDTDEPEETGAESDAYAKA